MPPSTRHRRTRRARLPTKRDSRPPRRGTLDPTGGSIRKDYRTPDGAEELVSNLHPRTVMQSIAASLRSLARPLESAAGLDGLIDRIGDSRFVLLGEASHGTSEFYT